MVTLLRKAKMQANLQASNIIMETNEDLRQNLGGKFSRSGGKIHGEKFFELKMIRCSIPTVYVDTSIDHFLVDLVKSGKSIILW